MIMSIVDNLAVALRKARKELQKEAGQIAAQIKRIEKILKSTGVTRKAGAKRGRKKGAAKKRGGRRRISAAGRARIAAAQRKRWAKVKAARKKKK